MTNNKEYYVSEPHTHANASIIWLHGLGASGDDFAGIVTELGLPSTHGVRFIFPNAPFRNITVNQGMKMRAWYDINSFDYLHIKEDTKGIQSSQTLIEELIHNEIEHGINNTRIILAGFSQGGAMALYTGLRYKLPLGGIIALSTYLPSADSFDFKNYTANHAVPIFMAHGLFDPIVPYSMGQMAYKLLSKDQYRIAWHSYPMLHTVCPEEITAIGAFIRGCLGYA